MENRDPELGTRLSFVIEALVRTLRDLTSQEELSSAWSTALGLLDTAGPLRVTTLAHRQGISQPATTQMLDRMAAEGLVGRTVSDSDRRVILVDITDAGRRALRHRRAQRAAHLGALLGTLSEVDRTALTAALPALERLVATPTPPASRIAEGPNPPQDQEKEDASR